MSAISHMEALRFYLSKWVFELACVIEPPGFRNVLPSKELLAAAKHIFAETRAGRYSGEVTMKWRYVPESSAALSEPPHD